MGDGWYELSLLGWDVDGVDVALDSQGRAVVLGQLVSAEGFGAQVIVVRLTPDGAPDTSFSGDGRVQFQLSGDGMFPATWAEAVDVRPDEGVVVARVSAREPCWEGLIWR